MNEFNYNMFILYEHASRRVIIPPGIFLAFNFYNNCFYSFYDKAGFMYFSE